MEYELYLKQTNKQNKQNSIRLSVSANSDIYSVSFIHMQIIAHDEETEFSFLNATKYAAIG